jgi:hypothetical protein
MVDQGRRGAGSVGFGGLAATRAVLSPDDDQPGQIGVGAHLSEAGFDHLVDMLFDLAEVQVYDGGRDFADFGYRLSAGFFAVDGVEVYGEARMESL